MFSKRWRIFFFLIPLRISSEWTGITQNEEPQTTAQSGNGNQNLIIVSLTVGRIHFEEEVYYRQFTVDWLAVCIAPNGEETYLNNSLGNICLLKEIKSWSYVTFSSLGIWIWNVVEKVKMEFLNVLMSFLFFVLKKRGFLLILSQTCFSWIILKISNIFLELLKWKKKSFFFILTVQLWSLPFTIPKKSWSIQKSCSCVTDLPGIFICKASPELTLTISLTWSSIF